MLYMRSPYLYAVLFPLTGIVSSDGHKIWDRCLGGAVLRDLIVNLPFSRTVDFHGTPLAVTPSPSPSVVSSDNVSALPSWLLVALLALVTLVVLAMFALTAYSLSAPRSTLKNVLGLKGQRNVFGLKRKNVQQPNMQLPPPGMITPQLVKELATSARGGKRTTRTTLAIAGFSLLGVIVIAILGLSGQGVRDLRSQVFAAVTTLVATIAGFYFGAQTAKGSSADGTSPTASAPKLGPDPKNPTFTVGTEGSYTPTLAGTPAPTVSLAEGSSLPSGLNLDSSTGAITGTPDVAGDHDVTLIAKNGISPDAQLTVKLVIVAS